MIIITCFLLAFPAVVRATKILTKDEIALPYRTWIVKKFGKDSGIAYWAHCPWCTSIWVAGAFVSLAVFWPTRGLIAFFGVLAASQLAGMMLDRE